MNASTCGQRSVGNRRIAVIVCSVTGTADMTTLLSFLQFYKSALRPSKRDKCPPCVFSHFYSENGPRPIPRFSRQPARGGCGVESCDGPSGEPRGTSIIKEKAPPEVDVMTLEGRVLNGTIVLNPPASLPEGARCASRC